MISITTNGLKDVEGYHTEDVPLYLTDTHEVIEGPTYWLLSIAQSKGARTMRKYGIQIGHFLKFLDEKGYGAANWQNVDEKVIQHYILTQLESRSADGAPNDDTITSNVARVEAFYIWAKDKGYTHFLKLSERFVEINLKNYYTRIAPQHSKRVRRLDFRSPGGVQLDYKTELRKFLDKEAFEKKFLPRLCEDDFVYAIIALVIWMTGLRPIDFFQLPYRGKGKNAALRRYEDFELELIQMLPFHMISKRAKARSIDFPGELWAFICKYWMPLRQERALLYQARHPKHLYPPNEMMFLAADGTPVTERMIRYHFQLASGGDDFPRDKVIPYMLRHSFATYFIYTAMKKANQLGNPDFYDLAVEEQLRRFMGHEDIKTTFRYYVHLVCLFQGEDLLEDLRREDNMRILSGINLKEIVK